MSNKPILSFGPGCAINLDDIEDFPDYYEVVAKLIPQIQEKSLDYALLKVFLDADLEDLQHIPQFPQVMKLLTDNYHHIFKAEADKQSQSLRKFIIFLLKVSKNYFTSYSIEENEAQPLIAVLKAELPQFPDLLSDFLLAIATFAAYAEKHEEIVDLYLAAANQPTIFQSEEMSLQYVKSIDKILRFRSFRQAFQKITAQGTAKLPAFFRYKLSKHLNRDHPQKIASDFLAFKESLENIDPSQFISKYVAQWQSTLKLA